MLPARHPTRIGSDSVGVYDGNGPSAGKHPGPATRPANRFVLRVTHDAPRQRRVKPPASSACDRTKGRTLLIGITTAHRSSRCSNDRSGPSRIRTALSGAHRIGTLLGAGLASVASDRSSLSDAGMSHAAHPSALAGRARSWRSQPPTLMPPSCAFRHWRRSSLLRLSANETFRAVHVCIRQIGRPGPLPRLGRLRACDRDGHDSSNSLPPTFGRRQQK